MLLMYRARWCFEDWPPFSSIAVCGGCDDENVFYFSFFWGKGGVLYFFRLTHPNCFSLWAFVPLESSLNLVASRDDIL